MNTTKNLRKPKKDYKDKNITWETLIGSSNPKIRVLIKNTKKENIVSLYSKINHDEHC